MIFPSRSALSMIASRRSSLDAIEAVLSYRFFLLYPMGLGVDFPVVALTFEVLVFTLTAFSLQAEPVQNRRLPRMMVFQSSSVMISCCCSVLLLVGFVISSELDAALLLSVKYFQT